MGVIEWDVWIVMVINMKKIEYTIEELINHPKLSDDYKFDKIEEIINKIDFKTLSDDEIYEVLGNSFKVWRNTPKSANVNKIMYNDELKELVLQFKDKSIYTYYDVEFGLFMDIVNGSGVCKTSGSNKWGSWEIGKTPSVGAAVYERLVERGVKYKKGGSLK